MDLTLNRLKTASSVSVTVTVIVLPDPESSDTRIDLTTAVVAVGTVYKVVADVPVKSAFLLTNVFAIMPYRSFQLLLHLLNLVETLSLIYAQCCPHLSQKIVEVVDRIVPPVVLAPVLF